MSYRDWTVKVRVEFDMDVGALDAFTAEAVAEKITKVVFKEDFGRAALREIAVVDVEEKK